MRFSPRVHAACLPLLGALLLPSLGAAADWQSANVQYLHGNDFELGDKSRDIITVEYANGWAYGDNFFFADVIKSAHNDEVYGEFSPRLSFSKMAGGKGWDGPIKDVLLAGQVNFGEDFRAHLYGFGVDLNIPGFAFFQLNLYVRDDENLDGKTWQISPAWLYPFELGASQWTFGGFLDYAGEEDFSEENYLFVPQLLLDVGALWGSPGHVHAGIEYSYWKNKFGIDGLDEEVTQAMVKWTF